MNPRLFDQPENKFSASNMYRDGRIAIKIVFLLTLDPQLQGSDLSKLFSYCGVADFKELKGRYLKSFEDWNGFQSIVMKETETSRQSLPNCTESLIRLFSRYNNTTCVAQDAFKGSEMDMTEEMKSCFCFAGQQQLTKIKELEHKSGYIHFMLTAMYGIITIINETKDV